MGCLTWKDRGQACECRTAAGVVLLMGGMRPYQARVECTITVELCWPAALHTLQSQSQTVQYVDEYIISCKKHASIIATCNRFLVQQGMNPGLA